MLISCSQESDLAADEAAIQTVGAFTPGQKAQIMELAEYYGLGIMSEDNTYKVRGMASAFHMDSEEMYFRFIAPMKDTRRAS